MTPPKALIITPGARFGRLTVVKQVDILWVKGKKYVYWLCLCRCGGRTEVQDRLLKNGQVRSCGCLRGRPRDSDGVLVNPEPKPRRAPVEVPTRADGMWFWRGKWREGGPK